MNVLTMPTLHVGHGTHLGGLSVFPIWTDAPTVSGLVTGTSAADTRLGAAVIWGEPCRIRAGSGSFQVLDLTLLLHLSEQAAGAANQHV